MCNCCVIVILFEELSKSSVTGEVEAREAGKGEEERKIGSKSGPEWAGSGGGGGGGDGYLVGGDGGFNCNSSDGIFFGLILVALVMNKAWSGYDQDWQV